MMNEYIVPLPHNDPRLLSNVSQAFSLVDLGKRLLDAAKNGDVESVKNLISSGAPFTTDWLGISPLHFAAMNGHLSSCDALLRAGISRDARTKVDRTPLHLAAQEGHADIVELLLQNGADIGAFDMLKMTALHWAAERGHTPVVQMLMRFGADPDVQNKFEMSPLNIAESKGYREVREIMLVTHYDMLPSVGRMAAMSGDMAHANAYILTDEETFVPAAPPAGEVIVTATNVTENVTGSNPKTNESISVESNSRSSVGKQPSCKRDMHKADENCVKSKIKSNLPDRKGQDRDSSIKLENCDNDLLLPDGEYNSRDLMIVETPDGETFYVQHHFNLDEPNSVVILNSDGEPVQNPNLAAEVLDALDSVSDAQLTDSITPDNTQTIMDHTNFEKDFQDTLNSKRITTPKYVKVVYNNNNKNNNNNIDNNNNSNNNNDNHERTIMKKSRTHNKQAKMYPNRSKLTHSVANNEEKQNQLPDDEDSQTNRVNDLITRLAEFADHRSIERIAFTLDGAEVNTSTNDLMMWCLCNGLFVRDCSDSTFVVEFTHKCTEYHLAASYDPHTSSILFSHLETDCCADPCIDE